MIRFWSRLYVAHLEEEILHLRSQVEHERARAEMAIDTLLNIRVGVNPVTVPTPASMQESEVTKLIDKLAGSEFSQVGEAE